VCKILRKFDIDSLYICPPYLYTVKKYIGKIKEGRFWDTVYVAPVKCALTVTPVHDIKIYVGFIETNIRGLMLDNETVAVGSPYDGRPVVLRRRRSRVGLGSIRRRRSGRLEIFVEVAALGTGAECLQSVSGGVAVSWKYLRQGVVGG